MNRIQTVRFVLFFLLGCVAAPLVNRSLIRPASAASEGVRKWEQYCSFRQVAGGPTKFDGINSQANEDLKARGLEGWELTSTMPLTLSGHTLGISYCFRRSIP
jgi:hypothetical protein